MTDTGKMTEIISAIRNYDNMLVTANNTPDEVKALYERLTDPRSAHNDGMPRNHNPHAGEEAWASGIDRLGMVRERYEKALCFLLWFRPAWEALTETERKALETYKYSDCHSGIIAEVAAELNYSTRQLHRVRRKALDRLQVLLFGM